MPVNNECNETSTSTTTATTTTTTTAKKNAHSQHNHQHQHHHKQHAPVQVSIDAMTPTPTNQQLSYYYIYQHHQSPPTAAAAAAVAGGLAYSPTSPLSPGGSAAEWAAAEYMAGHPHAAMAYPPAGAYTIALNLPKSHPTPPPHAHLPYPPPSSIIYHQPPPTQPSSTSNPTTPQQIVAAYPSPVAHQIFNYNVCFLHSFLLSLNVYDRELINHTHIWVYIQNIFNRFS